MFDYRPVGNGDLFAPKRGDPPPAPEGYEIDRFDPYLYHPKLRECPHRELRSKDSGCETCKSSDYLFCKAGGKAVVRAICRDCTYLDDGILDVESECSKCRGL